jgi:peptidoglycan/LPS O-acetylase OafA/YrhL
VEVFFVISGFAIERSIESTQSAGEFLRSRAVRIYPTFWAAVVATFTVVRVFGLPERAVSFRDALVNLTMIPTSLGAPMVDAVYWTLERELRFYGFVLVLLALGLRRWTVPALLATVALQTLRVAPLWVSDLLNLGWAHLFACGALLARYRRAPSWWKLGLVALCVLAGRRIGFLPFAYGTCAVALVWLATTESLGARLRPLVLLGNISYPLYLVHQYVGYVLMRALYARGAPPSAAIALAMAVAFALAAALHLLVEKPCLELLRRRRTRDRTLPAPPDRAAAVA